MHRVQILAILKSQYKILNAQLLLQIWCYSQLPVGTSSAKFRKLR